jgi:hypothetical protein
VHGASKLEFRFRFQTFIFHFIFVMVIQFSQTLNLETLVIELIMCMKLAN